MVRMWFGRDLDVFSDLQKLREKWFLVGASDPGKTCERANCALLVVLSSRQFSRPPDACRK